MSEACDVQYTEHRHMYHEDCKESNNLQHWETSRIDNNFYQKNPGSLDIGKRKSRAPQVTSNNNLATSFQKILALEKAYWNKQALLWEWIPLAKDQLDGIYWELFWILLKHLLPRWKRYRRKWKWIITFKKVIPKNPMQQTHQTILTYALPLYLPTVLVWAYFWYPLE